MDRLEPIGQCSKCKQAFTMGHTCIEMTTPAPTMRELAEDCWNKAMGQWQNRDGYISIIETALTQICERTLDECAEIALHYAKGPLWLDNGTLNNASRNAESIAEEILKLKGKQ